MCLKDLFLIICDSNRVTVKSINNQALCTLKNFCIVPIEYFDCRVVEITATGNNQLEIIIDY